jgi:hypothetical protein
MDSQESFRIAERRMTASCPQRGSAGDLGKSQPDTGTSSLSSRSSWLPVPSPVPSTQAPCWSRIAVLGSACAFLDSVNILAALESPPAFNPSPVLYTASGGGKRGKIPGVVGSGRTWGYFRPPCPNPGAISTLECTSSLGMVNLILTQGDRILCYIVI